MAQKKRDGALLGSLQTLSSTEHETSTVTFGPNTFCLSTHSWSLSHTHTHFVKIVYYTVYSTSKGLGGYLLGLYLLHVTKLLDVFHEKPRS